MTLELLVAVTCLTGDGCSEMSKAYYSYKPGLKQYVKAQKVKLEDTIGRELVWAVPISYAAATYAAYQVRLTRSISCGRAKEDVTLCLYTKEF